MGSAKPLAGWRPVAIRAGPLAYGPWWTTGASCLQDSGPIGKHRPGRRLSETTPSRYINEIPHFDGAKPFEAPVPLPRAPPVHGGKCLGHLILARAFRLRVLELDGDLHIQD